MAVTDIYRITPVWTYSDGRRATTHIDVHPQTGVSPAPDIDDVGGDVATWWGSIKANYPGNISLDHVELRRIKPLEDVIQSYTTGMPVVATGAGEAYDPAAAIVLSLRTDFIGRRYRGRMYLPPVQETDIDSGLVDATVAADFVTKFETLMGDLNDHGSGSCVVCVYSKVGNFASDVTLVLLDKVLRSQDRREIPGRQYV